MKEYKKHGKLTTLDQLIEEEFGPRATESRDKFEKGFKTFEKRLLDKK